MLSLSNIKPYRTGFILYSIRNHLAFGSVFSVSHLGWRFFPASAAKSAPPELLALCQLQVLDSAFHMVTIPSTVIACWHHQSHRCYTTTFWHHFLSSFFVLTVKRWTVTSSQEDYKVFKRTIKSKSVRRWSNRWKGKLWRLFCQM